ncbi:MAG: diphthamide biosynthesis enzyme Dph2 [Sulfolobales archaeon]
MSYNVDDYNEPPYDFEIERIVEEIKRVKARKILIQLPDGLKIYSRYIYEELARRVDVEINFSGDSAWGSCLLNDVESERGGYDLLVHIGHMPYPYYRSRSKVLFIPAYSRIDIDEDLLKKASEEIERHNARKIAIFTTIQHEKLLPKVSRYMSQRYEVISPNKGPIVMGCEYSSPISVRDRVDLYLIISGGVFHALGLGLAVYGKPVIKIDPYERKIVDLSYEINKIYKIRIYKIHQASEARNWILIDGVRGQNRSWYRKYLENLLRERNREYIVYISEIINRDLLYNIDSRWAEAYVILACPRIPIDDLWDFPKPVLTPGEARIALNGGSKGYSFPW